MDEYNGKRVTGGLGIARRGPNLALRDSNNESKSTQCCNRLGCSTRANAMKGTQIGYSEKAKSHKPGFRSSSSKAIVGSPSRPLSTDLKRCHQKPPNTSSSAEPNVATRGSRQESMVVTEPISTAAEIHPETSESEDKESTVLHDFSRSQTILEEVGNCAITRNPRSQKPISQRSGSGSQDTSTGYLGKEGGSRRSFVSRKTNQSAKSGSQGPSASSHRYGLGNLSCASVSDVLPLGCSLDSGRNRRDDMVKKRVSDGESSSARGKSLSGPSNIRISSSQKGTISTRSNSFQASSSSNPATRRATRNWPLSRDGVASVRTRRTTIGDTRTRLSEHGNANVRLLPEPVGISSLPQTDSSSDESSPGSSSGSVSTEFPSICLNNYAQTDSHNETVRSRGIARRDDNSIRSFHGISIERESYRRFNMGGIAEVLLALDRIGHDEELTYEQLLIVETGAFLGGLFHDQHRDMRLDIDNMSYEELLALEEKMGSVSTALTEEALSNCLKRSCYNSDPSSSEHAGFGEDDYDVKCSICQEEYAAGDEVGRLHCEHRYHAGCIQQWLRQKNWCPICKAPASPY